MTTKILTWSFYILFFLTPLFFLRYNSELFEYNKMMLVYLLTTITTGTWIIKMIQLKQFILKRTPLDIPILLFLISQILSTIFSIDIHTSIWGYYSRSNGGLLSLISYLLLYYGLISNFNWTQAQKFLKVTLWGGMAVSLYAIPEHFGVSPSCILLQGSFNADCWVQNVQSRVFATLGQPNWLAAYLEMLIFPALYLLLTSKQLRYLVFTICYFLAFIFTYSRGATLGLAAGILIFVLILGWQRSKSLKKSPFWSEQIDRLTAGFLAVFLVSTLLFGSSLTGGFRLFKSNSVTARPTLTSSAGGSQLETGGTESGQIRLIVWQGALDIFKHYPILGSGVETFAYSYYQFRPVAHNLTTEWDFLYNKAHNEYLNYLATTGLVGFLSYMLLILVFIVWCFSKIFNVQFTIYNQFLMFKFSKQKPVINDQLIIASILAAYVAYLIQNFFGFSVVIVALFFFLFPSLAFLAAESVADWKPKKNFISNLINRTIYRKPIFTTLTIWIIILATGIATFTLIKYWWADKLYNDGQTLEDTNPGRAFNILFDAANLNPNEPLYHSELSNAAASSAVALATDDATTSAILKTEAIRETQKALQISPANTSIWRTAIRTYYDLSLIDPSYNQKTLDTFDQTIKLAPTDPKLYYNKALVLVTLNKPNQEIDNLKHAIQLKPDYTEAIFKLGEAYQAQGDLTDAKAEFEKILQLTPNDPGATEKLLQIATASSQPK